MSRSSKAQPEIKLKPCPVCKRLLLPFAPAYEKFGCGGDMCPMKDQFLKMWQEAAERMQRMLAAKYPKEYIALDGVQSYKDLL